MQRLFVAAMVPPSSLPACEEEAKRIAQVLGPAAAAARPERNENLHFTLKFLGDTAEESLPGIQTAVAAVAGASVPFEIVLEGVGAFPDLKRPRIIFIEVTAGAQPLVALADAVEKQISPLGFPSDPRGFKAHLTMARVKDPRQAARVGGRLGQVPLQRVTSFRVSELALVRSELGPGGSRYTQLFKAPLAG